MKRLLNTLFVMTEDAYLALENDNVVIHQNDKTSRKCRYGQLRESCVSRIRVLRLLLWALRQTGRFYGILFTERPLLLFRVRGGES